MTTTIQRFHRQWLAVAAFLAVLLLSTASVAQSGAGAIQGTVTDATGAVLPGTKVHVVNQDTHLVSDTTANSKGFYSVPGLFAGSYAITFSSPGMKQYVEIVDLQVAQTAVISASLSVGSVSQEVTVSSSETIQLATYDSGTMSKELDNSRINQLPMNGRNILGLAGETTPGLEASGTRANGGLPQAIEYVQDGSPVVNRDMGGPAVQVDPDAAQEVRVETSASSAMYATPATAVITTKSGTNRLHGSLFETARNNAIGIARSRANPSNFVAPRYIRNEFGASVGGPIFIPKVYDGKNKSFFFFAYERYSLRSGSYALSYVPTQAMRNGDFSNVVSGGNSVTLYDPNTTTAAPTYQRTAFTNNQIPTSRLSPLAKALYAITPLPTNTANPYVQPNISYPATNNATAPTITFRLDHTFNEKNNAYLRYTSYNSASLQPYSSIPEPATIAGAGLPANASNLTANTISQYTAGLGFTHIFSPTLVSQTVIGNTWESTYNNLPPGNPTANYESQLGIPNNFGEPGMPYILGPLYQFSGTQNQWGGPQMITNIDENLTKVSGKHQFMFGGRYRHERFGVLPDRTADQISFNGMGTADYDLTTGSSYGVLAHTGNANADEYLGNASSYSVRLNAPYEHWRDQEFDAYFQDNYRVTNKLTVNLGLRWEAHPVATERDNLINGFDEKTGAVVLGTPINALIQKGYTTQAIITNLQNIGVNFETAQEAGLPPHLVYGSNAIFNPRVAIAYAPKGSGRGTVFRAGYGRYTYPIPLRNFYASSKANEPFAGGYAQSYTSGAQSPDGLNNYILRSQQTVVAGQNSSSVVNSSTINSILPGVTEFVLNPHYPPNVVSELNTTVEQPLKPGSVLSLSYVFSYSTNLDQLYYTNNTMSTYVWETTTGTTPPGGTYASVALNPYNNKTYGALNRDDRNGWANYNALQANYQRPHKNGYGYQLSYVFAKAMRVGGNTFRDGNLYPAADYVPGTLASTDYHEMNRIQNYQIDSAIPRHHVTFNGIVDLPIGKGKKIFGGANRFVDELIGGYQVAFAGGVTSQYFQPSSSYWGGANPVGTGSINPIQLYKHKSKVTDCTSGVCLPGYLWYNGFLSPFSISNPCNGNTVSGLPSNYQPYQTPINMTPGTITCANGVPKASNSNFLTNNVPVQLSNGTTVNVAYSPGPQGLNPYAHTYLEGPFDYSADISIFKVFPITERVNLRVNVDAFNAFNVQGDIAPSSSTGIEYRTSSYNTPRQIQLTARLTF